MESLDIEPKYKKKADEYIYFEEFIRGTLDLSNYPNIMMKKKDFARHIYRYSAIQGYPLDKIIELFHNTLGDEIVEKAKKWKVESIKAFPSYDAYKEYFGIAKDLDLNFDFIDEPKKEKEKKDLVIEIAKEILENDSILYTYIKGFGEFVYWAETFYKVDWDLSFLSQLVYTMAEEKGASVRKNTVNEVKEYIKAFSYSEIDEWDTNRNILVFKNGYWNISEQKFYPPDKNYKACRVIEKEYHPCHEIPLAIRKFLNNLRWNQLDQIRWLVALKSTIDHSAFDSKKMFVHFGVPNAGKSTIYLILREMLGENKVAIISIERLHDKFMFGNGAFWFALVIDEIEQEYLETRDYQKFKAISSGIAIPAEKKHSDIRFIYPYFSTHQTMNTLYKFPQKVQIDPICDRFILFKYTERYPPDPSFKEEIIKASPNLLNYLLTANLPSVQEISAIPLTNNESNFDLSDPNVVSNYWDIETERYTTFIGGLITFKKGSYITIDCAVDQVAKICQSCGYRIDKVYFKKKLIYQYIRDVGGYIITIADKSTGRIFTIIKNIRISGAKGHFELLEENDQTIITRAKDLEMDVLGEGGGFH